MPHHPQMAGSTRLFNWNSTRAAAPMPPAPRENPVARLLPLLQIEQNAPGPREA
jgi:hypothetical protein